MFYFQMTLVVVEGEDTVVVAVAAMVKEMMAGDAETEMVEMDTVGVMIMTGVWSFYSSWFFNAF